MMPDKAKRLDADDPLVSLGAEVVDSEFSAALDTADRERFAALEEVARRSSDLMVVIDGSGSVLYANPTALKLFGLSLEEGLGTSAFTYLHPDDVERVVTNFLALMKTPGGTLRDTVRSIAADGEVHDIEIVSTNALDSAAVAGIILNGRDVTEHNQYVRQLQALEQRFRLAFEDNMAPMLFTDLDDRIMAANDAFCKMTGFGRDELIGRDSTLYTFPADIGITEESYRQVSSGEAAESSYVKRYLRKDGRLIYVEVLRSPARDAQGNILYYVISERDITDERALAAQLSHRALHDMLTGLPNRALFDDRFDQTRAKMAREGGMCAVLILDLDDFKGVNDSLGHLAGDQLLIAVARRLERVVRDSDTLSRFGGDEFLYLAEGLASLDDAENVARRLLAALEEPFAIAGTMIQQAASIGVVASSDAGLDPTAFLQSADVALYEAKRLGKGRYVVFTPSMQQQAVSRFTLVQELRQALEAGELAMHYQPIVDLATQEIVGFEALTRWRHASKGWVPPNTFIPAAEQSDLIIDLGKFAIRESIRAARSWERFTGGEGLFVTVNLSARQFHDESLIALIDSELRESGLDPHRLIVEITESVTLLNVAETLSVMQHFAELGVAFALDDFGTGYSSLSYLALLHPKILKIDQSFVSPSGERPRNDVLLEAIISLGRKLNMTTLAEGVETAEQLQRLRGFHCELGQGFLWSQAVPLEETQELLHTPRSGDAAATKRRGRAE